MNKIIITGNLTVDPVSSKTSSGVQYAQFTVAVKRKIKNKNGEYESDFLNVVAFRQTADYVGKYIKKGNKVGVVGSIQNRSYTGKDGQKKYVTEIIADEVESLTSKSETTKQVYNEAPVDDDLLPF